MLFEWDEEKDKKNIQVHNISFDVASDIFYDPYCIQKIDTRFDYDEERWQAIGAGVNGVTILLVAYTYRDDENNEIIRLISARRATTKEKKEYENRKKKGRW